DLRRGQLQDLQPVGAVGDVGEQRRVGGAYDHVVGVVELSIGVEFHVQLRRLGSLHVDDRESFLAGGNVGVGACDVDAPCVGKRNARGANLPRLGRIGHVDGRQPLV